MLLIPVEVENNSWLFVAQECPLPHSHDCAFEPGRAHEPHIEACRFVEATVKWPRSGQLADPGRSSARLGTTITVREPAVTA